MEFEVVLLIAGLLLIVVGVVGQVKFKEVEIGAKNRAARITLGVLGLALTVISFNPNVVKGLISGEPDGPNGPVGTSDADTTVVEKPQPEQEPIKPISREEKLALLPEEGVEYMIRLKANNDLLHEDGGADSLISTRFQTTDGYSRFVFEKQPDQSYRIHVVEHGRYLHEDGGADQLVSTRFQSAAEDPFTRFWIEPQDDGSVKIKVVADNRYWGVDAAGNQLVTTFDQTDNDFSRFYLDKRFP